MVCSCRKLINMLEIIDENLDNKQAGIPTGIQDSQIHSLSGNYFKTTYTSSVLFKFCGISLSITFVFFTHVILSSSNSYPSWQRHTYESSVGTQICVQRLSIRSQIFSAEVKEEYLQKFK